ncbi:MAG TPA: radical SAM family heme chaperone HemW [Candidatus Deferrimicrobium sp.]|nr:radical SAM family heme chaperone HemW [Candidatus Deferrimicrobium sp.]
MIRDTEYIFNYPPVYEKIRPAAIWRDNQAKREIALYVHIPFCKKLCHYCLFNKYLRQPEPVDCYLLALKKEIMVTAAQPALQNATVAAVYLGGGTPSCLNTGQLSSILELCFRRFNIAAAAEITIEANPDSVTVEKLEALSAMGINRINFGVQSLNDEELIMLGCGHTAEQAVEAIKMAFGAGFTNIGIDLMYRIPGQTLAAWQNRLAYIADLNLSHIAIPELSIDPGSRLYESYRKGKTPPQPDDAQAIMMYEKGCEILTAAGYHHYNLGSDFSLAGKECLYHRMNREAPQKEILGIGAGAYSHINETVYFNLDSLDEYIESTLTGHLPLGYGKKLSREEKMARYMIHGVYFVRVDKKSFAEEFGETMNSVYGDVILHLAELGWVTDGPGEMALTPQGRLYVDNISKAFYEEKYIIPLDKDKPRKDN